MKIICIVQARMGSSRLRGKVLMPVKGKPLIVHTLDRLKKVKQIDRIILATSDLAQDRPLVQVGLKEGVGVFTGSENDVLDRYYQAALPEKPDLIVRCTGDCPLLDPGVTDQVILQNMKSYKDYTSNTLIRSYPRGLDTEVFTFKALKWAAQEARKESEREHVTPYLYTEPGRFSTEQVVAEPSRHDPELRICVDTAEDMKLIETIFDRLYDANPLFGIDPILALMRREPQLRDINSHVEQKKL